MSPKIRLGDLLVENELITADQLNEAIDSQRRVGHKLGKVLVDLGYVNEQTMLSLLAKQLRIPFVSLKNYKFDLALTQKLSETNARRYRSMVLAKSPEGLLLGMADPLDIYAYDELHRLLKQPLKLALIREDELLQSFDVVYRGGEDINNFAEQLSDEMKSSIDLETLNTSLGAEDAPVVKMLSSLFEKAIRMQASDIHIEPDEEQLRIRQRIDGVLHEQIFSELRIAQALTQRLKLMARLDISERRLPQDGHFMLRVQGRPIDVRLSTLPTQFGESVVLRILDPTHAVIDMEQLGLPDAMHKRIKQLSHSTQGMLMVTGPTGSGKTTTLYSLLNTLNQAEKKIITVEDPIEYHLPRVCQVQVNPKIDLDFARVLRASLRQDPDILMVGEIRDPETANIAIRAAMTGHFVLATLHTNDAIGSIMRLVDFGIEGYMKAAAIKAVIAQRLLRRVCQHCCQAYTLTDHDRAWLDKITDGDYQPQQFVHGAGCQYCSQCGYRGRIGVYELLEFNNDMLDALRANDPLDFAQQAKLSQHYRPLGMAALDLAMQGVTSLKEVWRIAFETEG